MRNPGADGYPERLALRRSSSDWQKRWGHVEAGMESEERTAFEPFFGASCVAIRPSLHTLTDPDANVWAHSASQFAGAGSESTHDQDFELAAKLSLTPEPTVQTQKAWQWMIFRNLDRKAIRTESLRRG
jgi:hypothetical protein